MLVSSAINIRQFLRISKGFHNLTRYYNIFHENRMRTCQSITRICERISVLAKSLSIFTHNHKIRWICVYIFLYCRCETRKQYLFHKCVRFFTDFPFAWNAFYQSFRDYSSTDWILILLLSVTEWGMWAGGKHAVVSSFEWTYYESHQRRKITNKRFLCRWDISTCMNIFMRKFDFPHYYNSAESQFSCRF